MDLYHDQSRALQDLFDSRRIADRLAEKLLRAALVVVEVHQCNSTTLCGRAFTRSSKRSGRA